MAGAFYNEIDEYTAGWLRNLIAAGHIAPGVVDTRSIEDIEPHELHRYTQCHFFAGIGVWSRSLRAAGWPDDRPVWTGSCPCQPFSAAGKGAGFADERHLWPAWHHLIRECRPADVFGEQVASKDVDPWIDLVQADMEALGYAVGAVAFPAAGVGAPHIRDRCYWVANAHDARSQGRGAVRQRADQRVAGAHGVAGGLAHADGGHASAEREQRGGQHRLVAAHGGARGLAHPDCQRSESGNTLQQPDDVVDVGGADALADDDGRGFARFAGLRLRGSDLYDADGRCPVGGQWAGADWIPCRDDRWRPVEPGTFPLAHGAPARVGRLRAYGNAIVAPAAAEFIGAYLDGELA